MENTFPTVQEVVNTVAGAAGNGLIDAITTAVPLIVPVLAALWAVRYVLAKIGLGR